MEDYLVQIISDGGAFLVTTVENSEECPLDFYPVGVEAMEEYVLTNPD